MLVAASQLKGLPRHAPSPGAEQAPREHPQTPGAGRKEAEKVCARNQTVQGIEGVCK